MRRNRASDTKNTDALRADLGREHEAIMKVVSEFDSRLMTVKGVVGHLVCGCSGSWISNQPLRSVWARSCQRTGLLVHRRPEQAAPDALLLTHVRHRGRSFSPQSFGTQQPAGLRTEGGLVLGFDGKDGVYWSDIPVRRSPENVKHLLARAPWMANVFLPHAVAVVLGLALFISALLGVPGLDQMRP